MSYIINDRYKNIYYTFIYYESHILSMTIKNRIENLDVDDLTIRTVSVNRDFVNITYDSDLEQSEVKDIFEDILSDKDPFGFQFGVESVPDGDDTVNNLKFRVR